MRGMPCCMAKTVWLYLSSVMPWWPSVLMVIRESPNRCLRLAMMVSSKVLPCWNRSWRVGVVVGVVVVGVSYNSYQSRSGSFRR